MSINETLKSVDPAAQKIMEAEEQRQEYHLEMIASENFTSRAVMEAQGSVLTNKYAEGYPGKRYYSGCENMDDAESLAIDRAKELFGAEYVNVQPHSGAQANMAVYFAVLKPSDKILAMDLAHGGHLTHGSSVNFSGKLYEVIPYGVDQESECIDYEALEKMAVEHKPKMIVCGASAYPREINFARFGEIAKKCSAFLMADIAHISGLVAAKEHADPIPHCDFVTSTTQKSLRGPRGGIVMTQDEKLSKKVNSAVFPGMQGGPLMHTILAKAVAFGEALKPEFKGYAKQVKANAQALAEGLEAQNVRLLTGGTDNHLVLMDLRGRKLTGKVAEKALETAGIATNKNMVPFDTESPFITSGIRMGTPALTTRGMKEAEMKQIAGWVGQVFDEVENETNLAGVKEEVTSLCKKFPLYT